MGSHLGQRFAHNHQTADELAQGSEQKSTNTITKVSDLSKVPNRGNNEDS